MFYNSFFILCTSLVYFTVTIKAVTPTANGCYKIKGLDTVVTSNINLIQDIRDGIDFYTCFDYCKKAGLTDDDDSVVVIGKFPGDLTVPKAGGKCYCGRIDFPKRAGLLDPNHCIGSTTTSSNQYCTKWNLADATTQMQYCGNDYNIKNVLGKQRISVYLMKLKASDPNSIDDQSSSEAVFKNQKCLDLDKTRAATTANNPLIELFTVKTVQGSDQFFFVQHNYRNNPNHCTQLCKYAFGAIYAGLADTLCFCAYNFKTANFEVDSKCSKQCPGDPGKTCGDNLYLSVYAIVPDLVDHAQDSAELVGINYLKYGLTSSGKSCYPWAVAKTGAADQKIAKKGWVLWGWPYDVKDCANSCAAAKDNKGLTIFKSAGLYAGKICFCSEEDTPTANTDYFQKISSSPACTDNMKCIFPTTTSPSLHTDKCGNFNHIQAYKLL